MTEEPTMFGVISSNMPRLANNAIVCARDYTLAGVRYAWTNLDWPIHGGVAGRL
jgi:hypothetical protein